MSLPSSTQAAGLEAVFHALRPELERRARAMGAADEAEDVLQDVWIRVQGSRGPIANPRAYLFRMVYTGVLDRRRGRLRTSAREAAWVRDAASAVDPATSAEAERALIARETLAAVEARLEALGDPAAMIFRRHRLDGHTQRRIAEDLRMGLSTVEKHLRRAYAALLGLEGDRA
ncbi:MAG: RNA polymerase sigma factor [Alphaproteobacteria bacterium]|uniref:RNA polymerase sigma factor n=1 Tax=Brevundimonas sp. TaxID=1871086 RepID=UPI001D5A9833|nr:RNA polymerase sigma factor [Alphaproteobacteria bacterium]MBU1520384.1 RNA polymerase sigma factor [Alphaproteobacteria bacterium]MBU2029830.1 RNA polymerase sigma factor [Alphaproteobacteria bacterium]MBU2164656.1 RNA polymerase sigma factor [Alphaproteobacteria bacterium]MBU2231443.1 RNA polymerase sigma factor [Alphaproteobacteria bacterium]